MYKSWLQDDGFNLDNLKLEKIRYNFYGFEDLTFIVTESGFCIVHNIGKIWAYSK